MAFSSFTGLKKKMTTLDGAVTILDGKKKTFVIVNQKAIQKVTL